MWMNEWDIERALDTFSETDTPNLLYGAQVLDKLREWTDSNSDGWAFWPKPAKAASRLSGILYDALVKEMHGLTDITDQELRSACRPVKAFLTRHGVSHCEIFR